MPERDTRAIVGQHIGLADFHQAMNRLSKAHVILLRRLGLSRFLNYGYRRKLGKTDVVIPLHSGAPEWLITQPLSWKYDLLLHLLPQCQDPCFVDVGARVGESLLEAIASLASMKNRLRYFGFEPDIDSFVLLQSLCRQNGINASLFPWACGDVNQPKQLFSLCKQDSGATIVPAIRSRADAASKWISCYRLDALESLGLPQNFILKIDVEGFENEVLSGAVEVINACRPMILCEVLHAESPSDLHRNRERKLQLASFLDSQNYAIHQINKCPNDRCLGLTSIIEFPAGLCWWDSPNTIDFLFTPKELAGEVSQLSELLAPA